MNGVLVTEFRFVNSSRKKNINVLSQNVVSLTKDTTETCVATEVSEIYF